jgi:hypothetical protein
MYACGIEKMWLKGERYSDKQTSNAYDRMHGKAAQIIKNAVRGIFPYERTANERTAK